ncbi:hypothetical protein BJ138DRAFT_1108611 [Hygrophoropsis aurantiaca]|uniref:Uncharacterized protein n=1 Tax=Hygrophoropsis aurantiaca TaxID=72124 RepID=A0ACB8ATL1_9AGAM|nr:hypothetical protein BJ138DRAFT_1108611 [Hygrophoropsis aurantiaca]
MVSSWLDLPALAVNSFLMRGEQELFGEHIHTRSRYVEEDMVSLSVETEGSPNGWHRPTHVYREQLVPCASARNDSESVQEGDTSKTRRWILIGAAAAIAIGGIAITLARLSTDSEEMQESNIICCDPDEDSDANKRDPKHATSANA